MNQTPLQRLDAFAHPWHISGMLILFRPLLLLTRLRLGFRYLQEFLKHFFYLLMVVVSLYSSVAVSSLTLPPAPSGGEKFVKSTATGSGNGSSWDNALGASSLRTTLVAGGAIYIAEGTYIVNTGGAVVISAGTSVIGGFPSTATGTDVSGYDPEQHPTIFDGNQQRVLDVGKGTIVIQGLQINNSNGGGTGGSAIRAMAGGQPYDWSILDSVFKNTTGNGASNAVWILPGGFPASSKLKISNCTFDNNVITGGAHGAALRLDGVSNNLYTNNNTSDSLPSDSPIVTKVCEGLAAFYGSKVEL